MKELGDPAGYELAYRTGLQAVEDQASTLRETRDRAGTLISTAVLAGGLAAGLVFTSDRVVDIGWPGAIGSVAAVAGLVAVLTAAVLVWRPSEGWFVQDAGVLIGSYIEKDTPLEMPEIYRELALWLGRHAELNRKMLNRKLKAFTWGLGSLVLEIVGVILMMGDAVYG